MNRLCIILFFFLSLTFFLFSYTQTDLSLLYSSHPVFVGIQNQFWLLGADKQITTIVYIILATAFSVLYIWVITRKDIKLLPSRSNIWWLIPASLLLLALSNPVLSYDLFNYIFDAKLVVHYHLDPHVTSAFSFSGKDNWVRFMRNVYFPTTYGYMWTALSLVPFILGLGKFLSVFVFFKLYMLSSFTLLLGVMYWMKRELKPLLFFFVSPLVLFETLTSGHNDLWMMLLAFISLALLMPRKLEKKSVFWRLAISFACLYASAEIKRSTVLLLPIWIMLGMGLLSQFISVPKYLLIAYKRISAYWADLSAILLFIPLLTPLSRQFHPWYLLWSFSFLPFIKNKLLRIILITFSITSLYRYTPILLTGMYSVEIEAVQRTITWTAVPLSLLTWFGLRTLRPKKHI